MRTLLLASVLLVALPPLGALAQSQARCLREKRDDTTVGALIGAGVGGLIGNAITHGRIGATIAGGASGAVVGAVAGRASARCGQNRWGYYDDAGHWVSYKATDEGYVDPDGRWIANVTPPDDSAPVMQDSRGREQALEAALGRRLAQGGLPQADGRRAERELEDIRAVDGVYRGDSGRLSASQSGDLDARLDAWMRRYAVTPDPGPMS
jgi:hypothetical protein